MKLLALIFGFGLEHIATQALHLRELRLFDAYFDFGYRYAKRLSKPLAYAIVLLLVVVLALPVVYLHYRLSPAATGWSTAYVLFALLVVFLSLGPRDLGNEIDEYCDALDGGDSERAERILFELSEAERSDSSKIEAVESAVFVQAPNRIFGVVFWFVLLGPVGAWVFRVNDLCRRRAAFESARDADLRENVLPAIELLHALLLWVPVRLAAIGYALSGSFDDAYNSWRSSDDPDQPLHRRNDLLVANVGRAAMTGFLEQPQNSSLAARNAMRLVTRTLFIWMIVVALMTLFGWAL